MDLIRLNKYLKDAGICSRRKADDFISKGYITVNGIVTTELGLKINPALDKVECLEDVAAEKSQFKYILLNKPKGYVCSKSTLDGKNIFALLPNINDLTYAGRLDKDSSGLLILSNDGQFVYSIAGSEFKVEKEYIVTVNKLLTKQYLEIQSSGVIRIGDKRVKPALVKMINEYTYSITLIEGINRQIRRMAENQGYIVTKLKRVRIGPITDYQLNEGKWRELTSNEISQLNS